MPNCARQLSDLDDIHNSQTVVYASISHNDSDSVLCDMLFDGSTLQTRGTQRMQRPIRGYRVRLRPIRRPGQSEVYEGEFYLEARFNLPPNYDIYHPQGVQLPGRRGSGSIYGSTAFVDGIRGSYGFYHLYSLPNRLSDADNPNYVTEGIAEGLSNNPELSDRAVIPAGLTCLWTGGSGRWRQICTASGRLFVMEGEDFTSCHVYDFLRPWNDIDAV